MAFFQESGGQNANAYATVNKKLVAMQSQDSASVLQALLVIGVSSVSNYKGLVHI